MKMRFLHSILCLFVVGSVLAVGTHDQPSKPDNGTLQQQQAQNVVQQEVTAAGSGGESRQTEPQGQPGVTATHGPEQKPQEAGKPRGDGSGEENTRTEAQVQPNAAGPAGKNTQSESQVQTGDPGSGGQGKKTQEVAPKEAVLGESGSSSGDTEATTSTLPTSTISGQGVQTEASTGVHVPEPASKVNKPESQHGATVVALPEGHKDPAEAKIPGQELEKKLPDSNVKEDEEEKEEEKEKGDEGENAREMAQETDAKSGKAPALKPESPASESHVAKVGGDTPESAPKDPAPTIPDSQAQKENTQGPSPDVSVQTPTDKGADGAPGKDGQPASNPKGATSAVLEPSAGLKQKPDAPEVVVQKPGTSEAHTVQASASDSEDEEDEEEEDDGEEEDDEISGEYHATDEIPEEVRRNYGRSRNGSPNGETRRDAVRRGSERTHTRNRRQSGSGSSSSGTQTDANSAGTQQSGKDAKGANQQGPESGSSSNQAPHEPTLETLVKTGSISEKQEIVTAFLKKDLAEGPLRKIFNYNDNSKTLETCRHLTQRKPKVCKAGNIKTEAPSANVELNRLVGEYLTHSVCTVEAALNQMHHSVHQGEYISNEIHAALKILSNVMRMNTTMRERYGDSEHILENLLQLFHAAEKALVSQSVQTVLYNRWALLDSVLCAVASGESNEVLDKINMDASNSSATAVVNLERFINSSTEVFVKAYKPFAELLRVIENGVLIKALELNKNEFREQAERVVQTITERHVSGISPATLTPLAQIPHSGMNTADIQRIAGQMGNSVSLVQRGQDVTQAGAVSPTTALRTAVLSLNIFKVSGNHIAPEIDESAVRTMVRSALLSFSEEEMVSKLIVAPQAALRVIYETIKLLVPIPAENGATAVTADDANSRIKEIERLMDENFRQVNQAVSRSLSTSGRANLPEAALIQTAVNHLGGAAPVTADLQTRATFTVDSRQEGANLEDNTNKYIEEQQFQKNMDNLVHIKSYSSATLAGTVGILALALVVIF